MSEQAAGQEPEALLVPADPGDALSAIFSFLVPEEGDKEAGTGAEADAAAGAVTGQQPAAAEGAPAEAAAGGAPAAGDGGQSGVQSDADAAATAAAAAASAAPVEGWTVDADSLSDSWAEVSEGFETNQIGMLRTAALEEVRTEYPKYFEALQAHPRTLVGQEVPSAVGEGMERLRDSADVKDWQDAIKHLLVQEVDSRLAAKQEELAPTFETIHASIDLFRNNGDLVPGTKQFDKELAEEFVAMASDYEIRAGGKLVGYSVPVQPLINQIRGRLAASRATAATKAAAAAPAPSPARQAAAAQLQRNEATGRWEAPQAGIASKAGASDTGTNPADGLMEAFYRQNGMSI